MRLQNGPGIWIPLTDDEMTRARDLLGQIERLAQTAWDTQEHQDRLVEFDMVIGFAAASAAIVETEGPEAAQKWRAKQYNPWKEQMRLISEGMKGAWRRIKGQEEPDKEKGTVVELEQHRTKKAE